MNPSTIDWLLASNEPWTRYRTRLDLLGEDPASDDVQHDYNEMLSHPLILQLIDHADTWPGPALTRHNDAKHPIYALSTLADFGVRADAPGMKEIVEEVLAHQSPDGPFEHIGNVPRAFGGTGEDSWHWMACDGPTLLHFLLHMVGHEHQQVARALEFMSSIVDDNGWRCKNDTRLGKFKGPGKREHPCPIANVYALKALSLAPGHDESPAAALGVKMLLSHWEQRKEVKYFLFGMGTDFRKLKYPFIWYDILHVVDVLSRYEAARRDPRLQEMASVILQQEKESGWYQATSMYRFWKEWSFADKKTPSPWLTFVVERIKKRMGIP
jgi:hypothetical protein